MEVGQRKTMVREVLGNVWRTKVAVLVALVAAAMTLFAVAMPVEAAAAPSLPVSGTCGTAQWEIDVDGNLYIHDGVLASNDSSDYDYYPWYRYHSYIRTARMSHLTTGKSISYMFAYCSGLASLDLSSLDTSNVTDMRYMFYGCSGLTSFDLSPLNTSNVTDMGNMFRDCSGLTSLDLSPLNTSNVTDMGNMFWDCSSLTSLAISNFDTSKVTNMRRMFDGCNKLTSLDVSSFDTRNVTNIGWMFCGCRGLTSLDVSSFDTSKVDSMDGVFCNCSGLTSLDVSHFDTSKVIDIHWMFCNCNSLTDLDVSNFNTSNVTDMSDLFDNCHSLTSLDLSNFDTSRVLLMDGMFWCCYSLTSLDLSNFDTSKVTYMNHMFYHCESLSGLDLSNFNINNPSMESMFQGCSRLFQITIGNQNHQRLFASLSEAFGSSTRWKSKATSQWYTMDELIASRNEVADTYSRTGEFIDGTPSDTDPTDDSDSGASEQEIACKNAILEALPDLGNLGSDTLKGPEISIAGHSFNLFKYNMKISWKFCEKGNVSVKYDAEKDIYRVMLGVKDKKTHTTEDEDKYWLSTYNVVKSLAKACGNSDSKQVFSQFSKLRDKLQSKKGNLIFDASYEGGGFLEVRINDDGLLTFLDGGFAVKGSASAGAKIPIWWIVYS